MVGSTLQARQAATLKVVAALVAQRKHNKLGLTEKFFLLSDGSKFPQYTFFVIYALVLFVKVLMSRFCSLATLSLEPAELYTLYTD